jgi:hypothetical protein
MQLGGRSAALGALGTVALRGADRAAGGRHVGRQDPDRFGCIRLFQHGHDRRRRRRSRSAARRHVAEMASVARDIVGRRVRRCWRTRGPRRRRRSRSLHRRRGLVLWIGAVGRRCLCAQAHRARLQCAADPAQRPRGDVRCRKLLVIERFVPDDDREHLSKMLDLEMLVVATGRDRTADEYADLSPAPPASAMLA